jgi:hypothetical protein
MRSNFLARAQQLADTRELVRAEPAYAAATALLSVHCAIAFSDAVLMTLEGKRCKAEDHKASISLVERACRAKHLDVGGLTQLRALLTAKTDISYGDQTVTFERAVTLAVASERFERWAYVTIRGVQ